MPVLCPTPPKQSVGVVCVKEEEFGAVGVNLGPVGVASVHGSAPLAKKFENGDWFEKSAHPVRRFAWFEKAACGDLSLGSGFVRVTDDCAGFPPRTKSPVTIGLAWNDASFKKKSSKAALESTTESGIGLCLCVEPPLLLDCFDLASLIWETSLSENVKRFNDSDAAGLLSDLKTVPAVLRMPLAPDTR